MIPIETLRKRVGLEPDDTSKDAEINSAMAAATAIAENYLDRKLEYLADYSETFTHYEGYNISLNRYPVCSIASIETDNGAALQYHLDALKGLVQFDGRICQHSIKITYDGGYHEDTAGEPCPYLFPADLLHAVLNIFDQVWSDQESGGGMSSDNVQSITINDVGTIRWGGSGAGGAGGAGSLGFIPSTSVAVLNSYKRNLC